jgi:type IV pilus assembly protein PilY1
VLVGGLGVGGQGIFALDITDPCQFSETNAASTVMWEFDDRDDPDFGYVIGPPVIRKMANGRWAAIVSGGYNNSQALSGETACTDSTTRTPAGCTTELHRLGVSLHHLPRGPTGRTAPGSKGTDYIKIRAQRRAIRPPRQRIDGAVCRGHQRRRRADFVYAGDLRGHLWKFDVRSTTASNWTSSTNQVVLFTARWLGNRQPITAKPEGTLHPTGGDT